MVGVGVEPSPMKDLRRPCRFFIVDTRGVGITGNGTLVDGVAVNVSVDDDEPVGSGGKTNRV